MKLLFWLALIVLVCWALHSKKNKAVARASQTGFKADKDAEPIVQCAQCGIHFPESEAITVSSSVFCSEEHRRLYFAS
ncbi:MAG: PP0621 family protein [Pseudomonadota bacterium]